MITEMNDITVVRRDIGLEIHQHGEIIVKLTREAIPDEYSALLRLDGQIAIYRVVQLGYADIDLREVVLTAIRELDQALCYVVGKLTIESRPNDRRVLCRSLMFGPTKFVHRDSRLIMSPLTVPGLGPVKVQDTGDTNVLYVQLHDLL